MRNSCHGVTLKPQRNRASRPEIGRRRRTVTDKQQERILERWTSTYSNARMEALNGIFKAARARARGYRNVATFITIIYLIAAPLGNLINST